MPQIALGQLARSHNGADDNASGTAALLEVADAISKLKVKPARSIVFAFWDAEERGLLGSKHWLASKPVEKQLVKTYINMDMVGRLRDKNLEVYGVRTAKGMRRILTSQNTEGIYLDFRWKLRDDSDHYPFVQNAIPAVMLHTGLHSKYHRPSDDFETINLKGVTTVSKYATRLTIALANKEKIQTFRSTAFVENDLTQKNFEQPVTTGRPRLGVTLVDLQGKGVQITKVNFGSPASNAGIRVGDIVTKVDGKEVTNSTQFVGAVANSDHDLALSVQRTVGVIDLNVKLGEKKKPKRIGLSWKVDAADDTLFYIGRVHALSPAEKAGLKIGDRLLQVDGKNPRGSKELVDLLNTLKSPIKLVFERRGIPFETDLILND